MRLVDPVVTALSVIREDSPIASTEVGVSRLNDIPVCCFFRWSKPRLG